MYSEALKWTRVLMFNHKLLMSVWTTYTAWFWVISDKSWRWKETRRSWITPWPASKFWRRVNCCKVLQDTVADVVLRNFELMHNQKHESGPEGTHDGMTCTTEWRAQIETNILLDPSPRVWRAVNLQDRRYRAVCRALTWRCIKHTYRTWQRICFYLTILL